MANSKTNTGLVEYAKAQLGLPYWYGTFGLIATEALYKTKKKQYPKYYASWNDFPTQYGKRVHDCVGLIKGYLWSDTPTSTPKYTVSQDVSANGMRNACKEKGDISTMPDIPGVLVFMNGHVGVYIGGGFVIEARGHEYGVVKTKLSGRGWKWWGKCPWISYDKNTSAEKTESGKKEESKLSPEKSEYTTKTVKIKAGTWNIRNFPKSNGRIVAVIKGGGDLQVLDGWEYVPELNGFISQKALEGKNG